jgi:hypothetical protein
LREIPLLIKLFDFLLFPGVRVDALGIHEGIGVPRLEEFRTPK